MAGTLFRSSSQAKNEEKNSPRALLQSVRIFFEARAVGDCIAD
jgi:hypothetical protein